MSWNGRTVLAVIPARGGSKGVPRKNLAEVGGLSLVARAARVALALPWLDRAVLSTDDPDIAEEGRRHGLEVPFMRPAELAGDRAAAAPAWQHAWLASEAHFGGLFDYSVWLQPTSPFRTAEDVERTLRAVIDGGHKAATTVSRVPGHFTPQKILTMEPGGRIAHYLPEGASVVARQEIPPYWYRNGLCYAVRRDTLVERGHIIEEDCVGVEIEGPVVNIDDPLELEIARFLAAREPG
jgi:CMP-N-acetylneuraminic acid synthetase